MHKHSACCVCPVSDTTQPRREICEQPTHYEHLNGHASLGHCASISLLAFYEDPPSSFSSACSSSLFGMLRLAAGPVAVSVPMAVAMPRRCRCWRGGMLALETSHIQKTAATFSKQKSQIPLRHSNTGRPNSKTAALDSKTAPHSESRTTKSKLTGSDSKTAPRETENRTSAIKPGPPHPESTEA